MSTPYWRTLYAQTNLFTQHPIKLSREKVAVLVGPFFEQLTGRLFPNTDIDAYLNAGDDRPDVIAWGAGPDKGDLLIECKASSSGHLFDVDQLETYTKLCRQPFPWTKPKLYYALWLYRSGHRLWEEHTSHLSLLTHLCSSIDALYLLPGPLVASLVKVLGPKTYSSWRGSKRATEGSYARLHRLHHHILRWGRPEALRTVAELLSVQMNGWRVTTTQVRTLELVGRPVEPFPVVLAADFPLKRSLCK